MAYSIPTYLKLYESIVQEIRGLTGLTITTDSDAGIRAAGTASIVEGLYHHQSYIQRQLFVATADEAYLYVHAEEVGLPRLGGTSASGTVLATANIALTISAGNKLTNGKGYYWTVVADVQLEVDITTVISVVADQIGSSWNVSDQSLLWVSPDAGLSGVAQVISIGGGTDEEALADWRSRLLERKKLGDFKDRSDDINFMMHSLADVKHVYIYPKRRGLGTLDVAITAVGTSPTVPSPALITAAQQILDNYLGILADCKIFSPTVQPVNVTAILSGNGVELEQGKKIIQEYFAELAPADSYQAAVLSARLLNLENVTDVQLTPNSNITPTVDWMHLKWLRAGIVLVEHA